MPSHLHEALTELFRHRPALAAELLTGALGVPVPPWRRAQLAAADLTDLAPTEYRADAVVTLAAEEAPVLAVVIEVQLRRDPAKRRTWPVYLTTLHARLRCPAVLLVVAPDAGTAAWCAVAIPLGHPGFVLTPLVLGPDRVPVVTDAGTAGAAPELAVLSAMAHGDHPDREKVLHALLVALRTMDHDHASLYADIVLATLPEATRHYLEALMALGTYEYQSDFARRYFAQGKTEGKTEGEAAALLAVLAARGIEVPAEARDRITGCTDLDQLDTWVRRASTASSIGDLFEGQ
jgi:hypothetical protein